MSGRKKLLIAIAANSFLIVLLPVHRTHPKFFEKGCASQLLYSSPVLLYFKVRTSYTAKDVT